MTKLQDSAHVLEGVLRESEEFIALKKAYEAVMNNPESKETFESFRDMQLELQEKQMQGLDITEEEVKKAQEVVELVQQREDISTLMEAEQTLNEIINDVSRIITKPLEELYGNPLS